MSKEHKTFFGKLIASLFGNHADIEETVKKAYEELAEDEQIAVQTASGYIAIINENIGKAPDEIFAFIQKKYPDATKENLTSFFSGIATKLKIIDDAVPDTFDGALSLLQSYLSKYEGKTWVTIVHAVVTIGTEVLNPNISVIQKIQFVLEYVYQDLVKPKLSVLPDFVGA